MRPESSNISYLWDMLDASMAIQQFLVGKTFNDYNTDRLLRGAVERHIEIIGEAARNVSADFQSRHPRIPWIKIIAQRHVPAHEYGEILVERIWRVASQRIPELIRLLDPLIPEPPDQDI